MWWCFIGLLLAIALGLVSSRSGTTLRLYFWAQLLYTLVVFPAAGLRGTHDQLYALIYGAATLPVIECCCFFVWEARITVVEMIAAINFGLLVGIVTAFGIYHRPSEDYVTFGEGVILSAIGMAMAMAAPKTRTPLAVRTIGKLSLALSVFDFSYLLNPTMESVWWLPSAMCAAAFVRIGLASEGT